MIALRDYEFRHGGGEVSAKRPEMRFFAWKKGDEIPDDDLEFIGEFTVGMLKAQGVLGDDE